MGHAATRCWRATSASTLRRTTRRSSILPGRAGNRRCWASTISGSVVELEKKYANGKQIANAFQTNGVLLNDAWAEFFLEYQFLIGISIDGPRELHDAYRVDKGGQPTFDRVMRGMETLQRNKVDFNTLTTVHRANADSPLEVYRFLRGTTAAAYMQFIPIVERIRASSHRATACG